MRNISRTGERAALVSFGPLTYIIMNLKKPQIIRNGGELTYPDYLPTKQKMQNISRTHMCKPLVSSGHLNYTKWNFEKALDDGEWWRTHKDRVHPPPETQHLRFLQNVMVDGSQLFRLWNWRFNCQCQARSRNRIDRDGIPRIIRILNSWPLNDMTTIWYPKCSHHAFKLALLSLLLTPLPMPPTLPKLCRTLKFISALY
jgi:hypothetical protein